MRQNRFFIGLGAVALALIICVVIFFQKTDNLKNNSKTVSSGVEQEEFSKKPYIDVWVPYWDVEAACKEVEANSDKINNICYFASYFDENNKPFLENATKNTHARFLKDERLKDKKMFLTFVNDVYVEGGQSKSKDIELLEDLFFDEASIAKHVNELIEITVENGFDGIEIDYEALYNNQELWNKYIIFENELLARAKQVGLDVRIVLEPAFPMKDMHWPDGPEYVVMCYNLHGKGTEAGDRANKEFLCRLVDKMSKMPSKVNFALATGGYDFCDDGSVIGVTALEASKLFEKNPGDEPYRDEASGQLYFGYIDDEDRIHNVWYADEQTLKYWIKTIKEAGGKNITIFRAGGTFF